MPIGRSAIVKFPSSLVATDRVIPVPVDVTSTVAPGIAAPCGSRTLPFICPDVFCAGTERAKISIKHGRAVNIAIAFSIAAAGCVFIEELPPDLLNILILQIAINFQRAFISLTAITRRQQTRFKVQNWSDQLPRQFDEFESSKT